VYQPLVTVSNHYQYFDLILEVGRQQDIVAPIDQVFRSVPFYLYIEFRKKKERQMATLSCGTVLQGISQP
jgi:hypothetical protein